MVLTSLAKVRILALISTMLLFPLFTNVFMSGQSFILHKHVPQTTLTSKV